MSEAKVIFTFEGEDLTIQCSNMDTMRDICQKYSTKVDKNIDSLIFLYGESQINFELTFKEQATSLDKANNHMKIIVCQEENESFDKLNNINLFENIKSKYIIIKIFSYIDEKVKLKSIKNNKRLQKKNGIGLINYKFFSGRYIIYETKTKGKEFYGYNDRMLFEGEYLNGERNGIGKEYFSDDTISFEGRYLNGKRNGEGKKYNLDGKLKFEGEYLNGNRWNGKGYDIYNKITYEIKNGKGFIKEYHYNGKLSFEGEYLNGERNGKGKEYNSDGKLEFEGEYLNGRRWNGRFFDGLGNIVSQLKNGKGLIKEFNENDIILSEYDYVNGHKNGKVKEYNYDGKLIFEGEYLNGRKNGKGKEYDGNGFIKEYDIKGEIIFEGEYKNGEKNGKGKELSNDGKITFEGEYKNGERNGKGKGQLFIFRDGKYNYEGEYLNGIRNGKGKLYYDGKLIFEGEYLYDQRRKGKEYLNDKLEYEGEYIYNRKWNGKGYDENGNVIYEIINGNGKIKEYHSNDKLKFE